MLLYFILNLFQYFYILLNNQKNESNNFLVYLELVDSTS